MRHWRGVLLCITLLVFLCTGLVNLVRMPGRGWSSTAVAPVILPGRCETPERLCIGNIVPSVRVVLMPCLVTLKSLQYAPVCDVIHGLCSHDDHDHVLHCLLGSPKSEWGARRLPVYAESQSSSFIVAGAASL